MPPKGKRTKAEEALDFLSNLDNLDVEPPAAPGSTTDATTSSTAQSNTSSTGGSSIIAPSAGSSSTPRASTDSSRPVRLEGSAELPSTSTDATSNQAQTQPTTEQDEEAAKALAFLEAQIKTKRAPLSLPQGSPSRPATPAQQGPGAGVGSSTSTSAGAAGPSATTEPANVPTPPASSASGWGSSWWSTATSAIQSAQKIADEGYKKVREEGVSGVTGQLEQLAVSRGGVDLQKLRKEAEERLGGIVKNVDLEKLRNDLYQNTTSALTNILNTVAPPISAHETLEVWLSHPMTGYGGVEGVIYRAWLSILEQTESGELVIVWSPPEGSEGRERSLNPVQGWDVAVQEVEKEIEGVKKREEENPKGRKQNGTTPVTTIPIFLHLQPLLAPLPMPEPPLLLDPSPSPSSSSSTKPNHLQFIFTLHDPKHNLRFTTTSQAVPGDWLDVEYDRSEWVEERLVDVLRVGVEVIAQDYVATRMALKPSAKTRPPTPKLDGKEPVPSSEGVEATGEAVGVGAPVDKKAD